MIGLYLGMLETETEKRKFNRLYTLYRQPMYAAAYQILKDTYLAEDAVHNAFLRLMGCLERLDEPETKSSRNYLLIIARNEALRLYNRSRTQIPSETVEEAVPDIQNVELETESREVQKKIYELIVSMETSYSDILLLKFYYDMEDSEIAETLGISLNNARVRLHRARTKLKAKLRKVYDHE